MRSENVLGMARNLVTEFPSSGPGDSEEQTGAEVIRYHKASCLAHRGK